jgi:PPOX class probable F420-dependent enzyme
MSRNGAGNVRPFRTTRIRPACSTTNSRSSPGGDARWIGESNRPTSASRGGPAGRLGVADREPGAEDDAGDDDETEGETGGETDGADDPPPDEQAAGTTASTTVRTAAGARMGASSHADEGGRMDADEAREFVRENHRAVLATTRRDGRPQLSPVSVAVRPDGRLAISTRETAMKLHNVRRDPYVSLCVLKDAFYGGFAQVEGTAEVLSLPEAMEPLVEYYRSLAGEHPDWDDYRAAMERERRVLLLVTIERAGPNVSG